MTPVFLLFMNKCVNQLDIYIDESGNFDDFSKHNLIYSVSFVMVDSADIEINNKQINLFQTKISKIVGGDHFVHVGNLVRYEKPYKETRFKERQDLFYILFLLAKYSKYKVASSIIEKKQIKNTIYSEIFNSINKTVLRLKENFESYKNVIVHYDDGQPFLKEALVKAFGNISNKTSFIKTLQQENSFMQVADLFSYFALLKFKIEKACLSKHEIHFFGNSKKIRKDYLKQLEDKIIPN